MIVAVTGASGFVGSAIAAELIARGHRVRLLLRPTSNQRFLPESGWQPVAGDVTQAESLPPLLDGADAVIHAAGLVKARRRAEFNAVNAAGTANVLAAATAAGVSRLVYISSLAAHGPANGGTPRPLDAPPAPVSDYGRSKALGEATVQGSALAKQSAILRLPVVYGPQDLALLPFFRLVKWRIAPLLWGGRNVVSVIYVSDAARAAADLASPNAPGAAQTYTADDGERYQWRDLLSHIEAAVGRKALLLPMPLPTYQAAAAISRTYGQLTNQPPPLSPDKVTEMRQKYWICSNQAIESDLAWRPQVPLAEGAKQAADWYRSMRLL